jgi:hypothetical protein
MAAALMRDMRALGRASRPIELARGVPPDPERVNAFETAG